MFNQSENIKTLIKKDKYISRDLGYTTFMGFILLSLFILMLFVAGLMDVLVLVLFIVVQMRLSLCYLTDEGVNSLKLYRSIGITNEEYIKARFIYILKYFTKIYIYMIVFEALIFKIWKLSGVDNTIYFNLIGIYLVVVSLVSVSTAVSLVKLKDKKKGLSLSILLLVSYLSYLVFPGYLLYKYEYKLKCFNLSFFILERWNMDSFINIKFELINYIVVIILTIMHVYISYKISLNAMSEE